MNALRSAAAVLMLGLALHAHDSRAVMILTNGTDEVEWHVGDPAPSINLASDRFVVLACGAELGWVYANFSSIPTRAIGGTAQQTARRASAAAPGENVCVMWRGDNARFIADNLEIITD
jgi:hypothetical protein